MLGRGGLARFGFFECARWGGLGWFALVLEETGVRLIVMVPLVVRVREEREGESVAFEISKRGREGALGGSPRYAGDEERAKIVPEPEVKELSG